jgi:hypothetical protein
MVTVLPNMEELLSNMLILPSYDFILTDLVRLTDKYQQNLVWSLKEVWKELFSSIIYCTLLSNGYLKKIVALKICINSSVT